MSSASKALSGRFSKKSVSTIPGSTSVTFMPESETSARSPSPIAVTANLVAE